MDPMICVFLIPYNVCLSVYLRSHLRSQDLVPGQRMDAKEAPDDWAPPSS